MANNSIVVDLRGDKLPEAACPKCGKIVSAASQVELKDPNEVLSNGPKRPTAGDLTVCNLCGACSIFDEHGQLGPFDESTLDEETKLTIAAARLVLHLIPDGERDDAGH